MSILFWAAAAVVASITIFLVWEWRDRSRSRNRKAPRRLGEFELSDTVDVGGPRAPGADG